MLNKFRISLLLLIAALGMPASAAPTTTSKVTEVTYLLPGPPTLPAFAPWMLALHKGYYAEENLKVNFVVGKGGVDVAKQIGAGNAPIGGALGDTAIIVRANGVPIRAVAVLGGGSLMQMAVHNAGPIHSFKDLQDQTVTVTSYTDSTYYALLGNLHTVGLTKNKVQIQGAGPSGVWQLFVANKAQAMAAVPDWVISAEDAGASIRLLATPDFQSMAQAILASDAMIKKNPELIQRLVRATLRGMNDIVQNPKAAVAAYVAANPAFKGKEASLERVFTMYRDRVYAGQKIPGEIDRSRMAAVQKFYVDEGVVNKAVPVDDLFTNQFINTTP